MILEVEVKFNKGLKNMFSLIISIISIALVAALAAATVYFGGAAFNKGGAGADASAFVNAGQQVAGAFTLATTDNFNATTVASLAPLYLAQVPAYKGNVLVLDTNDVNYVTATNDITADVCTEINKRANGSVDGVVKAVDDVDGLFGCVTTEKKAFYKVK